MNIRPATLADCVQLAQIQVDSYRKNYADILPAEYLDLFSYSEQEQDWCDWFTTDTGEELFVALDGQAQLAGYALGKSNLLEPHLYEAELVSLHVRSDIQGQGYGSQLVAAIYRALINIGCKSLFLWVLAGNPAQTFYDRLGGNIIGEKPWSGNLEFRVAISEIAYGWPDIQLLLTRTVEG